MILGWNRATNQKSKIHSKAAFICHFVVWFQVIASLSAWAQTYTSFNYSVAEGLPSSEVYEVFQDHTGFLWFATDNGVARYDGKEFQLFHTKDGLPDPVVFGFFEDKKQRIWFRTFSGKLSYHDGNTIQPYAYNEQLRQIGENGLFRFFFDSRSDDLWFTLEYTLGKIDSTGKTHRTGRYKRGLFVKSIDNQLLLGGDTQYSVNNITINDDTFRIQLSDTTDFKFFNATKLNDRIYISIYRDLFQYRGGVLKKVYTSDAPIISLSTDSEGNLWVGYLNDGTEIFEGPRKGWRPDFVRNKSVTKVLQDASSGVWFTTLESGVYHVPNFSIQSYNSPTTSRIKAVLSLRDTVLVGDQAGNLYFLDAVTKKVLGVKEYPHVVYSLFSDSTNNVWVSAGLDIIRYSPALQELHRFPYIATQITHGPGRSVWTMGGIRLTHFSKDGLIIKSYAPDVIYRAIHLDDSLMYLGARTGLHLRDLDMNLLRVPEAFADYKITTIGALNDTTLLFATQGNGLLLVNKKDLRYTSLNADHQFLAENIYCMTQTDSTLWLGTENGVAAIDIEKLIKNDLNFYHLTHKNGLVSNKINFLVAVKDEIWAFGDNTFSVIPRGAATSQQAKPVFYVKQIIAGADSLASPEEFLNNDIALPYNKNHLTFTFGYISFTNRDILLRYRISDKSDWTLTRETSLQFLSLAPGAYDLELEYSADNIHWQRALEPLNFRIDSPWWAKWYTFLAGFLIIMLIAFMFFHHRHSIYRQRNHYLSIINSHQQKLIQSEIETLERERKRIATELHDGVGTNLTAIKLMVSQLLRNQRLPQAEDVEEQFQIAIRELKDIIYGLTPPSLSRYGLFPALQNYVAKLDNALAPKITLQTFGPEIRNYEFNIMVFRIVQELITNSIKHSSAQHITIHINTFDDMLNIIYEDDGVGFSYDASRNGLGLDNIESRLRSMNGSLRFDSGDHGISYTIDIPLDLINQTL